ncbi:disease resistance protein RPV1-like [Diospyros lotus]|uniref:disease resistance protein RPV1-like n=1 Tax=Diospyros lotus TaxID=55363 RepID=UPI00225B5CEA|nr:disease resistance protein RPV1-like [Diospyros lotus]
MASTNTQLQDGASPSSGSSSWKYDVFLNFRGVDTRNDFIDHLYSALHERGIFTFKDDQKLERGESISPALLKAIKESRLAVVVFSENYASSKWCLEELVNILECQKTRALTVLPVFYKVDPSDLRKQRRSVGEAFAKHERDSSVEEEKQKVQRWRNALSEAANISGWDTKTHRPETELVRDIAIDILNRLGYNGLSGLEDVVGLHPRMEKVMSLLKMGSNLDDPSIVGICGMGGLGKTTIAMAVYLRIRSRFVGSSYLANVRETCEKHGLESLQKSLIHDICSVSDTDKKIRNIDLSGEIRNAVRNKRVLLVLDDVDHSDQMNALAGTLDWFGPGSKIIITTRNSHLLARYGPRSHVYNVEGLNHKEAFKLFCHKAFWNHQPTQGYEGLANSMVRYAGGVPLALKVLGSFLIGRSIIEWQRALDRLGQQPILDIQKVLKLSYDDLAHEEMEIFLDIACFFKQMSYDYIVEILDACGFHADIGIRVLEDKALVMIRDNKIDMHDLIQEMGWHIVFEESLENPGGRSRLWKYEDIYHTLTKKTGTEALEAMVFYSHKTKEMSLNPDTFSMMRKLRLLKLSNVQLPNGLDYLSNDLCLLDWHEYPLKCLPSNFQPDRLVKLKMSHSRLKQLWNKRMCLYRLKYVDLSYSPCITKILDFIQVTNLEELILEGCRNLDEIGPSIKAVKGLGLLNLRDCKYITVLPTGCWLKSLKELILSGCSKLKNVSQVLACTKCLIKLDLHATRVKELPVEHLMLTLLNLRDCKYVEVLPTGCWLEFPEELVLSGCSKLRNVSQVLPYMKRLIRLDLHVTCVKELPVGHLRHLQFIRLWDCKELTSLPSGNYWLKRLASLSSGNNTTVLIIPNSKRMSRSHGRNILEESPSSSLIPKECQDLMGEIYPKNSCNVSSMDLKNLFKLVLYFGELSFSIIGIKFEKYFKGG